MNTEAIDMLVAKWAAPDGIPFKGELIDSAGCMCAQGQALHYVGGWTQEQLQNANQRKADREVARLLGISVAHAVLLRQINDERPGAPSVVLTDPAQVLGDQAALVLAFWRCFDRMDGAAREAAAEAAWAATWAAAREAAAEAAREAATWAAAAAAREAATWAATWGAAWAAAWATNEIQGARVMRERDLPFFFLPMFGFADPEAVLAADRGGDQ